MNILGDQLQHIVQLQASHPDTNFLLTSPAWSLPLPCVTMGYKALLMWAHRPLSKHSHVLQAQGILYRGDQIHWEDMDDGTAKRWHIRLLRKSIISSENGMQRWLIFTCYSVNWGLSMTNKPRPMHVWLPVTRGEKAPARNSREHGENKHHTKRLLAVRLQCPLFMFMLWVNKFVKLSWGPSPNHISWPYPYFWSSF